MDSSGHFEDLLYHDRTYNKTYVVRTLRKGVKKASCSWTLLDTVNTEQGPLHLVRISLHTGRTHQIRVQFSSRRMPLVGDLRYGSRIKYRVPALWACGLSFPDPANPDQRLSFQIPPPDSWPWNEFIPDDPADGSDGDGLP